MFYQSEEKSTSNKMSFYVYEKLFLVDHSIGNEEISQHDGNQNMSYYKEYSQFE
jgi:hypothetical protein